MAGAEVDLLDLRGADLDGILQAVDALAGASGPTSPGRLAIAVELAVDELVRLVRQADLAELRAATATLQRYVSGPRGTALEAVAPDALDQLDGLLPVLAAAASPSSRAGADMVLRSWDGRPREVVEHLAAVTGHRLPRARLREQLGISESHLSHLLADLEAAGLAERVRTPGRRAVDVVLGPVGLRMADEGLVPVPPDGDRWLRPSMDLDILDQPGWEQKLERQEADLGDLFGSLR
jgi:hypothetical protein